MSNLKNINLLNTPVYYINLDSDTEKSEKLQVMLGELGFKNVNRFSGIKEETKKVGVAKSHNALLKDLSGVIAPFIIFEDDIVNYNFKIDLDVPIDSDAFYLGNSCFGLKGGVGQKRIVLKHYEQEIFRVYNMLAAHAILYTNNDYVKFLAKATEFNISILDNQDKARAETMKYWNIYANRLPMFYQNGLHTKFTKIDLSKVVSVGPEDAYLK